MQEKYDPRIYGDRFNLSEFEAHRHIAKLEPQITREHVLNPQFWSHVSAKMAAWDEIILRPDEANYYGRLLVTSCGSGWAKVALLEWHDLSETATSAEAADAFEILFKGAQRKHVIIRKSDQQVMAEGIPHKSAAQAWLDDYLKRPGQPDLKQAA
jgi:hypothetical protein